MASPTEIERLRHYVNAVSDPTHDTWLASAWDRAAALVANFVGDAVVPTAELDGATVEVASELYHRQAAPNGISQFADATGNPVRVARDPMVAAYKTLQPYVGMGIA